MAVNFPGVEQLGDSFSALFQQNPADTYNQELMNIHKQGYLTSTSNQGVNFGVLQGAKANTSQENSANFGGEKVGKAATTRDPNEVEQEWMQRLAKFAGIAQATGVKLGGV